MNIARGDAPLSAGVATQQPMDSVTRAADLIASLASDGRFAGSSQEAIARSACKDELRRLGFEVSEQRFSFSELPGKWAPPLVALLFIALASLTGYMASKPGGPAVGLVGLSAGLAIIGWGAARVAAHGTAAIPWMRSSSTNLVAWRGRVSRQHPGICLVAHIDSKSQTIPMHLRIASVMASALGFIGLLLALVAASFAQLDQTGAVSTVIFARARDAVLVFSYATVASLLPLLVCLVGNRSRGALDNATGVATILLAVRQLDALTPVTVVITSAEELGLAGARAFVESNPAGGIAINCDTIDDEGRFICMSSGTRSNRLGIAIGRAAEREGISVSMTRMLPGVLADNIAFTDGGWESVTISRGNLGTLARVHTEGDRPERITGAGVVQASRLLAHTVEELN
ncbi:MAG: M28 family metallopeptidase [Gemmatimonadota bacterium]|nr:M28 family metallopeptidase [Gemmatimonadota bacterium]